MRAKLERRGLRSTNRHDLSARRGQNDRNRGEYLYDDNEAYRRRYSISGRLAEDEDQTTSTCSTSSEGGFARGHCGFHLCHRDGDISSDQSSELRELRKDIKEMKKMIRPSTFSVVDSTALSEMHSKRMIIDLDRPYRRKNGKLMVLSQNDLIQVDTRDEEEKRRREEYFTELGRQGNPERELDEDGTWTNFLQCLPTCISWNNCRNGRQEDSDTVSDITTPIRNDYYRDVNRVRTRPQHLRVDHLLSQVESSGHTNYFRARSSNAEASRERSRRTYSSGTPSNGTPSSHSKSNKSPKRDLNSTRKPLRSSRRGNIKARMMTEDGSLLYEV